MKTSSPAAGGLPVDHFVPSFQLPVPPSQWSLPAPLACPTRKRTKVRPARMATRTSATCRARWASRGRVALGVMVGSTRLAHELLAEVVDLLVVGFDHASGFFGEHRDVGGAAVVESVAGVVERDLEAVVALG